MKSLVWKTAGALLFAMTVLGAVSTAYASNVRVAIAQPSATVGQPGELRATVTSADAGQPIAGVPVTFFVRATFGDVSGYMEIGRAVTNESGVATIAYVPHEAGTHDIRVDYALPNGGTTEHETASVAVDGSPNQMYVQTAGIRIPGLNSSLVIVLLSAVWAILFGVGVTLIRIAAARSADRTAAAVPRENAARAEAAMRAGVVGIEVER